MTETVAHRSGSAALTIRAYRPTDHRECRQLWAEMTEEHEGSADPGALFEEYLTRLDLSGMWVADVGGTVVGMVGLLLDGRGGAVEPLVVSSARRGEGIGRALLEHVADQARRRALGRLTISPAARNLDAIRCLHAAGYDALARVTLAIDLRGRGGTWQDGIDLHELRFKY
ncbi:GNAT family N-acetyltransferase [Dactylosporangium sucinum]|uniref:GNAT family N-acetyltransferase n=1 Tax=Dactylosporangium sucinum TaxID=1424081 RepID=UPI001E286E5D|nr:GNAT family N-acetyltransferase [Dactylosporangium sucinum]